MLLSRNSYLQRISSGHTATGFTLIEMAVVLIILTLVAGGALVPLNAQIELHHRTDTKKTLEEINEALIGFAIANGRLPCPASATSNGVESPLGGGTCTDAYAGFVPAVTLGLNHTDAQGYALDAWYNRIRYAVAKSNSNAFTTLNGMQNIGMANLNSELRVCSSSIGNTSTSCGTALALTTTSQNAVPAIIFSQGKNWATGGISSDEAANLNGDAVFISHTPTPANYPAAQGGEFDDIVTWLSPNILYNRMVAAGRLP